MASLAFLAVLVTTGAARGDTDSPPDPSIDRTEASASVVVELFWGDGCPYCEAERRFLDELAATRPGLEVREYEVWNDEANRALFRARAAEAGVEVRAVPTTFLGDRVWVGFSSVTADGIEAAVDAALAGLAPPDQEDATIDVPIVGRVDVGDRSLIVSTLLIGFVDGINPCSLWVLSVLLAIVLHTGSRRRVFAVGAAFLTVTSAMYGLYVAGAYSVLAYVRYVPWIQRAVAVVAAGLGLLQLKDVVAFHRGPTLGVPDAAKPDLYRRMRRLSAPDRPLPVVLGATAALAVGVSLLETPCTLGLPILWTNLIAQQDVPAPGAALLFLLYLAAFLVDELVVFVAAVWTMRALKLQEHHGRELKLVSGVLMLTLAAAMLIRPELMESLGGTMVVFVAAGGIAAGGLLLDRSLHPSVPGR
jgi:cytochrome c biogenesis protein CcdA/glutaredoxin